MGSSPSPEDLSTEELFRRFAPFVARFLYRLGVRSDGLDDLVQEVFLVVHRRGGYRAGPAKPTSYLATIAANAASAYRRRQRVEQARSSDTEVERLVSTSKGPVQVLEVAERLRLLQAALDRLEPELRSTLVLADIEGESCASIAASSGIPTGTVYWRLHEARKRFQRAVRAEMAGIPARTPPPATDEALASQRAERGSALALAISPLWFFSQARHLLRAGAAQPPVHYDVGVGLEQHRQLASGTATPSWAPPMNAASVAGQASTGIGIVGVGGAGIATVVAIVVGVLHAESRPPADDRSATPTVASNRAEPAAASSPAAAVVPPAPEPTPLGATKLVPASKEVKKQRAPTSAPSTAARSNPVDEPTPSVRPPADTPVIATDTRVEAREIARAERMLSSNPAGALALVRDARSRFKPSFLPEERDYIEVMALQALGRAAEAKAAASHFLSAYPGGAFSNRVRGVMQK